MTLLYGLQRLEEHHTPAARLILFLLCVRTSIVIKDGRVDVKLVHKCCCSSAEKDERGLAEVQENLLFMTLLIISLM